MNLLQVTSSPEVVGQALSFFDNSTMNLVGRLVVDLIAVFTLIRVIYFKHYRRTDLFLTFFGFNIIIFFITYLLNKVEMSMGAAFGLFAVFSMLRYRTEGLTAKNVTYLFLVIALGLITAISKGSWYEIGIFTGIFLLLIALLEGNTLMKKEQTRLVVYDKISLVTPERREELLADLSHRLGLGVHRVEIQDYDFLKDATQLQIFYYE